MLARCDCKGSVFARAPGFWSCLLPGTASIAAVSCRYSRAALALMLLAIHGCGVPASRTEMFHEWVAQQRVCDSPSGYPGREWRMINCGARPSLPKACEKPGTDDLPVCQGWIEGVRSEEASVRANYGDDEDVNGRW